MGKATIVMASVLFSALVVASAVASQGDIFGYWVPYVDTNHSGHSVTYNYLKVFAFEDSTFVQSDTVSFYLNGDESRTVYTPQLREGLHITSDKPLQISYVFGTGHYGRYEDGSSCYYLLEESHLGTEYWIPTPNKEISILATQDNTTLTVDTTEYILNMGQSERLLSVPMGTRIISDKPTMVVAVNYTGDHYGSTYAYEIYPTIFLDTSYYVPHQHPYSYPSATDSTKLYILSPSDSTLVTVNSDTFRLNQGDYDWYPCTTEVNILSDNPIYAVFLSDIYARDPWVGVYRHYDYALPLPPSSLGIREALIRPFNPDPRHGFPSLEVCIVSLDDNNTVILSTSDADRESLFLSRGEKLYYHEREVAGWDTASLHIEADASIQVTKTVRGWWSGTSESSWGGTVLGRRPFEHDVSVAAILAPLGEISLDTVLSPTAIVRNYGLNPETCTVSFRVGDIYSDAQAITLESSEIDTLSFADWIASQAGTYVTSCSTHLAMDEHLSNDGKQDIVIVSPGAGPIISGILPNRGGNTGSVTVEITGSGFEPGAAVKLTKTGQPDIVADTSMTTVVDFSEIITTFDLRDQELGAWNVVVINPDGDSAVFYNGFTTEVGYVMLWVDIVGPEEVRVGRKARYAVVFGNSGNVDIDRAVIRLSVGSNAGLYTSSSHAWYVPPEDSVPIPDIGFMIYDVPPGKTGSAVVELSALTGGDISLDYWVWLLPRDSRRTLGRLLPGMDLLPKLHPFGDFWSPDPFPEGSVVFQDDANWPPMNGHEGIMWYDHEGLIGPRGEAYVWESRGWWFDAPISGTRMTPWIKFCERTYPNYPDMSKGWQGHYAPPLSEYEIGVLHDWLWNHSHEGGSPLPFSFDMKCTDAVHKAFKDALNRNLIPGYEHSVWDAPAWDWVALTGRDWPGRLFGYIYTIPRIFHEVWDLLSTYYEIWKMQNLIIGVVQSWDPNDKAGPFGFGDAHHVLSEQTLQYMIYFENVDTATASAEDIIIVDTLDANLDWSTFSFGEASHAPTSQSFDPLTGVITWTFEDIDLPPNVNPPEGEGYVSYSVEPLDTLSTGSRIENLAWITFDYNTWAAPMDSIPIFNTIDASPPASQVEPLAAEQPLHSFGLSISGQDDENGSGIFRYLIYVSDNGGEYFLWLTTEENQVTYQGYNGHTYRFFSVAVDNVGNKEAFPSDYDAMTTIKAPEIMAVTPSPFVPARGHTDITFFGAGIAGSTIQIFNKAGELVQTLEETQGSDRLTWNAKSQDGKELASGVYIWVLKQPSGHKEKGKFAIIR